MRNFYKYIRRGDFRVAVCKHCHKKMWPPSEFCCFCYYKTSLKKIETTGTIVEFTTSQIHGNKNLYGIVDMQGIKLIGSLPVNVTLGMKVKMVECGILENGCLFYHFDAD